ncbi:hypothetical protein KUTeg_010112 [Tegillarca granosa]|uniref:Phospholipase A2-like central domain-containing protein n=1 Tax=Tegillarca granosa TaxID=220873 RepID=A0ABQ9F5T8_TEGGR|nr:hypothetical protein KUTeg_010112 [Tegillarca granosa]
MPGLYLNEFIYDRIFRDCLQQSVSPTAPFLGDIYFNIMGTKCFEFEYEKVCTSRSWWGGCLKREKRRTAHVKEQKPFDYN